MRVVDLRQERRKGKKAAILSEKLSQAIADRLEKREQTILFLNRRGFSTSLLCSNCGEARNCPNCSVALTFHRHPAVAGRLSCHLCGHTAAVPKKCPACGQDALIYHGTPIREIAEHLADILKIDIVPELNGEFRPGEMRHLTSDTRLARSASYESTVDLSEGITRYIDWIRKQSDIRDYFSEARDILKNKGIVHRVAR